jgi:GTPase
MKSGFVALVGRSNVGKSTLLNTLVGTKVAITSRKPQTTRYAIQGVVHDPRGQIVFVDTPGIFEKSHNTLTKTLNERAREAVQDIDVVLYVADATRPIGNEERIVLRLVEPLKKPKVMAINKIDVRGASYIEEYRALGDRFDATVEISALRKNHVSILIDTLFEYLSEGDPLYPEFQYTNIETKEWLGELIREKLFIQLGAELPYTVAVEVLSTEKRKDKQGKDLVAITANILTNNPRHKQMLIGKGGRKIKEIGSATRKELELVLGKHVFLKLEVVVDKHWPERLL